MRATTCSLAAVKHLGIVGMGLMGHGLAQMAAQAGIKVTAVDIDQAQLSKGMSAIESSLKKILEKQVKEGKLDKSKVEGQFKSVFDLVAPSTTVESVKDCDLVVEAIVENLQIKKKLFSQLNQITKPDCILASNTSSFSITELADSSNRSNKFVGLHFFNPVQLMKLVEVIKNDKTEPGALKDAWDFVLKIGKEPVECSDTPGFIVNRLLVPFLGQALLMIDRGDAEIADIDVAMRLGAGLPMGPIVLADYVGLDTCLSILRGWHALNPNEPAYQIPKCLEAKVAAGDFGRKTGKGFYVWDKDTPKKVA
eukprot:NODE_4709_length_1126_cov_110.424726_g4176_i0.p1 GENE.NODE_4709_length_1126_cov_110.424726_g4176_i0~~NODE_4709_length_1126_cov_110.424726_g4176_i0.p1  ORF type:complete len:309 (-),score=69.62 NODE_4709_length_1126_cov_110.424726_g4176_i0:130-1056(-)